MSTKILFYQQLFDKFVLNKISLTKFSSIKTTVMGFDTTQIDPVFIFGCVTAILISILLKIGH